MRKGLLSAAALLVGGSPALAQAPYWQGYPPAMVPQQYYAQQYAPQYYGQPMPRAPMPQAPYGAMPYYPQQQPAVMPVSRRGAPTYLPNGYFPATMARPMPQAPVMVEQQPATVPSTTIVHQGPAVVVQSPGASVPGQTVGYPRVGGGSIYYDIVPQRGALTTAAAEPVEFHRKCRESMWVGADYFMAWIRSGPMNTPLLTTSTNNASTIDRGAIGSPGTIVLFGDKNIGYGVFSGFRAEAGLWLDQDNCFSADVSFSYLFPRHVGRVDASDGSVILGRPFFNVADGEFDEDVYSIADNDSSAGRTTAGIISIDNRSQFYGGEINGRWHGYFGKRLHAEGLGGFRVARLMERLAITDSFAALQPGFVTFKGNEVAVGDVVTERDVFETNNTFFGFQVGGRLRWEHEWFYMDAFAKVGLGLTYQNIEIDGAASLASGGVTIDRAMGGVLAVPSNIGEIDRIRLGVMPEVGLNFGVDVTDNIRLKAGYSFMLWSGVTRPGHQLDRNINAGQVPGDFEFGITGGPAFPQAQLKEHVFWLQTLNFGLEFHY